jgi:hypothetical protein
VNRLRTLRPKQFVQLPHDALDTLPDFNSVGLLAHILRHDDGWDFSLDRLVASKTGIGRQAAYKAMRTLIANAYVVKVKWQDAGGLWHTDVFRAADPHTADDLAEIAAMYAPGESVRGGLLVSWRGDESLAELASPQVAPTVGNPTVGGPTAGSPTVKEKNKKKNIKKNSSPPLPSGAESAAERGDPAGREDETPSEENDALTRAQDVVDAAVRRWPSSHRAPGPRDRQRLAERVARELATGGDEATITDELTRDLNDAASAVRVVLGARTPPVSRRRDPGPPGAAAARSAPGSSWPSARTAARPCAAAASATPPPTPSPSSDRYLYAVRVSVRVA